MQAVMTVSLNRTAVQVEQDAHARLADYLADASTKLAANPDRTEILLDLEQAVADQCKRRMLPGQTVITLTELGPALEEMGPVEVPDAAEPAVRAAPATTGALQQVSEGAMISGVCKGLARAAAIDVTLVRVIAVILLFATGGAMIILYAVLMLLIPFAPLAVNGPPLRKLPAKCREYVLLIRSKLSGLTS
jgi:phage shock protein PspC (stress-responsive transcriptional regulator)